MTFRTACIQLNASDDMEANITKTVRFIHQAKEVGAEFIVTPENTALMVTPSAVAVPKFFAEDHPALRRFQQVAKELSVWLVIGSLAVRTLGKEKLANRSFLINNQGNIVTYYDKIHLFDVTLSAQEEYKESARCVAGKQAIVGDTPWGKVGMTVCYDVRFPHLFRELAKRGAKIITVPAAFTEVTGEAHWHVLLRARAIETGCYILAPAQTGVHPGGRKTYGHSLIIDPWGKVIADGGVHEGVITADIDLGVVDSTRLKLPSLYHNREFL